jgi:hypothetical protein
MLEHAFGSQTFQRQGREAEAHRIHHRTYSRIALKAVLPLKSRGRAERWPQQAARVLMPFSRQCRFLLHNTLCRRLQSQCHQKYRTIIIRWQLPQRRFSGARTQISRAKVNAASGRPSAHPPLSDVAIRVRVGPQQLLRILHAFAPKLVIQI